MPAPALKKLARLGPRGWYALARAQWAILRWTVALRFRPAGELISPASAPSAEPANPPESDHEDPPTVRAELERARELATGLDRAARFGLVRPLCLVRSLALQDLLEAESITASRVRVGVRTRDGRLESHAWVECHGRIVGDAPERVAAYSPVPRLEARALTRAAVRPPGSARGRISPWTG